MPITRVLLPVLFLSLAIALSSCASVRQADYKQSLDHPEDAHPAPIKFTKLKTQLPVGSEIGIHRHSCFISFHEVGRDYLKGNIGQDSMRDIFSETLEMQDYDVVSRLSTVFDEEYEDELLRSEYKIGAKIIDVDIDSCKSPDNVISLPFLPPVQFGGGGHKGKLFLKIEWAVYDSLRRKVAYKTTTEGYIHRKTSNIEGLPLMINEAFAMAAHNLGADPHFHDLIFYGRKPPQDWKKKKDLSPPPRIWNPQEYVRIENPPLSYAPLQTHIATTARSAVLIEAGQGHGSGFFITQDGHILTNAHVIGNARRVRVVTAAKSKKLIAEVLRKDVVRDVALLKLEEKPEGFEVITAPIKTGWPQVSSEIYALGAPEHRRLQDTITKGIVSAHRKNFSVFGTKMDFIQGDIVIRGGNSGGPLLDENGNIVGITVAGLYNAIGEGDSGLNLFIPIEDALAHLDIAIE